MLILMLMSRVLVLKSLWLIDKLESIKRIFILVKSKITSRLCRIQLFHQMGPKSKDFTQVVVM